MKLNLIFLLELLVFCGCGVQEQAPMRKQAENLVPAFQQTEKGAVDAFKLSYSYAGFGSNYGSMQPTFNVNGTNYIYNLEQNSSFTGEFNQKPELVCKGKLRASSVDSIMDLVKDIQDTLIYETDPMIMSGGIHFIRVEKGPFHIEFKLHNASDPTAHKIVDILNSNIPANKKKLWLFELRENN